MQLIDHPPQDPERGADAAFTAAIMARVSAPRQRAARGWWLVAAAVVAAGIFVPLGPQDGFADLAVGFDGGLMAEAIAISAALGLAAFFIPHRARAT